MKALLAVAILLAIGRQFARDLSKPELWQRPLRYGPVYGVLLYGIMNYIVLPLSAARPGSKDPLWIVLSVAVHAFLIGTPCAIFARRAMLAPGATIAQVPVGA